MAQIDLSKVPVREANERIRAFGEEGEDVEVINPDARHHIGVGLISPITVRVRGSAGYFCAGLTDKARFEIDNNVGWGLGDNIYEGTVIVDPQGSVVAKTDNHHEDIAITRVPIGDFRENRRFREVPAALIIPVLQAYQPAFQPNAFLDRLPETYKEAGQIVREKMKRR